MICEATKLCNGKHGCGQVLPVSAFSYTKDGFRTYCLACSSTAAMRWNKENPERKLASGQRWHEKNPINRKAHSLKKSAHKAGPSDIDLDWVMERLERGVCELSGVPFVYEVRHPCLPSIDRIDPTQPGHMKDNCRVILWGLNGFKGAASERVFLESLEKVSAAFVQG